MGKKTIAREELAYCDFIKIGLMLFVVLGHATRLWGTGGWFNQAPVQQSFMLHWLTMWIGSFHIYAFTLVSGYIFSYLRFEKGKYREFLPFFKSKVKRLIVPYIFVAAIWAAPWHRFYFDADADQLIQKYVLGISPSQLWFVLMLFWVFLTAYFLSDFIYNRPIAGLIISLLLYGIGTAGGGGFLTYIIFLRLADTLSFFI